MSFTISNEKSLLDILDSVEEIRDVRESKENIDKKCKCCNKVITYKLEDHQIICFQKKVKELSEQIDELKNYINNMRENMIDKIRHEIHIKGLELWIERNNEKWNKLNGIK